MSDIENIVVDKFIRYVKINTTSDENSNTTPSTLRQYDLQNLLKKELEEMKLENIELDKNCILSAELPANNGSNKSLGFLCHVDTSPECSGENVKPIIHDVPSPAKDIILPIDNITIPKEDLEKCCGKKIITASGDTLLGADDKSGIAILMTAIEHLIKNKDIKHPRIVLMFTPDEEIGRSCDNLDHNKFKLDYGYSIDGDEIGTYNDEGFIAHQVNLKIEGVEVHPGSAYNKMVDAGFLLSKYLGKLPEKHRPEVTKDDEGYILCIESNGSVREASAKFIVRSFRDEEMESFLKIMKDNADELQKQYPKAKIIFEEHFQYDNMKKYLPGDELSEKLASSIKETGVEPQKIYMRGGCDASHLSQKGLPCINMFAGGVNFHSRKEFVPIESMVCGVKTVINLVKKF